MVANRFRNPGPPSLLVLVDEEGVKSTGMIRWVTGLYRAVVGGGSAVTKNEKMSTFY